MHLNTDEVTRISYLIRKKINNDLTATEESELNSWVSRTPSNEQLYRRCLDVKDQQVSFQYLQNINATEAWKDIKGELNYQSNQNKNPKIGRILTYTAAAGLLIFAAISFITQRYQKKDKNNTESAQVDYKPASNQATIKLSNGKSFTLDNTHDVVAVNPNSIAYSNGQEITSTDDITSAEINTPRGGYYKIILPDGTRVQLNAASSLSYPLSFNGQRREVTVSGEVYFEVTPNKNQPFVVHTQNQEIEVLGTVFNINAYEGNRHVKTSLVEGKVKVSSKLSNTSSPKILLPGQQSVFSNDKIVVKDIDIKAETAWINGKFNFDGKKLREVMKEISNWYDVDVLIENDVPNIEFFGGTFRNNNLSTILTLLEQNDIKYTLSGDKKLFIKKN